MTQTQDYTDDQISVEPSGSERNEHLNYQHNDPLSPLGW